MPFDGGVVVAEQRMLAIGEADETLKSFPVTPITPSGPFARVTESGPPAQFVVQLLPHLVESDFGTTAFVVIGPTPDDGIEFANQSCLRATPIIADNLFQVSQMASDGFLTGSNQGLETGLTSVCPGFVSAHLILPDVEAQEIEADLSLVFIEGVADGRFGGVKLQAYLT